MKFLMETNMYFTISKRVMLFSIFLLVGCFSLFGQVPSKPDIAFAVNDFTNTLTDSQRGDMEKKLVDFADTTSNRIVVVIVNDLAGMEPSQFAFTIGEQWGVGSSKFNNGVVILVKPKTDDSRGQAFIAIGYGLEGIVPDAIAKRIVENEMIPFFKDNDYYGGIDAALNVLFPLLSGEITYSEWEDSDSTVGGIFAILVVLFVIFVIIMVLFGGNGGKNMGSNSRKGPSALDVMLLSSLLLGGKGGSSGSFGGSGGFGGGFGGGSFGGGGAGGSW